MTEATTVDGEMTQVIQGNLASKELLSNKHLLDSAYVDAHHLVTSGETNQSGTDGKSFIRYLLAS